MSVLCNLHYKVRWQQSGIARRYFHRKHVLTLIFLFYATYTTKFAGNSQVSHAAIFVTGLDRPPAYALNVITAAVAVIAK
jgi:hypothetical protein